MKTLNVMEMPLNKAALIEASAGTGKTYTMANLYLRLLLGVGCEPLTVEQILVVTFTKAATAELRDRIRANIQQCHAFFKTHYQTGKAPSEKERYYFELYQACESAYETAVLRLRIAEREMDLASVYTIHGFCQKMLTEFAFESGMRFDFELHTDESELLKKLSEAVWREQFYPLGMVETKAVATFLRDPESALKQVRGYLSKRLPTLPESIQAGIAMWQTGEFAKANEKYTAFLSEVKGYWQAHFAEIVAPILADFEAEQRALNGNKYQLESTKNRIETLRRWSLNAVEEKFPEDEFLRFCEEYITGAIKKGCEFKLTEHFAKNQTFLTAYQAEFADHLQLQRSVLQMIFLQALQQKLKQHKAQHSDKGFDDLLILLNEALSAPYGAQLAAAIRSKFPFAMIDEFQDTDQIQYEIFSRIFISDENSNQGFIMIGDPKQSIYKFRGADIFTYLKAAEQAEEKRTLGVNWRSLKAIVEGVNQLFTLPADKPPFLYNGIQFQAVQAKSERPEAIENGEREPELFGQMALNAYLQPNEKVEEKESKGKVVITRKAEALNEQLAAEQCAHQIQQQLKLMQAGEFGLRFTNSNGETESRIFAAKDIAILVRSRTEAKRIKQALAKRQIKSVFMSERSSVYQSDTAADLIWILRACLTPYQPRALLAALGCSLWGFTAAEIFNIKNSENEWDNIVERFVHYQQVWQQEGILPMLHQLYLNEGVIERLRGQVEADRTITDLLHLTELLQAQQSEVENEAALVRWYANQIADSQSHEANSLRLESEEELIKILTIHSSKGLQYPIVWLPFVGVKNKGASSESFSLYQDKQAQPQWDFGSKSKEVNDLRDQAEFSEDLRLLYVALTRAESQLNLILPERFPKSWNAMLYLLSNGEIEASKTTEISTPTATLFQQKAADFTLTTLPETAEWDDWVEPRAEQAVRIPRYFTKTLKQDGQVTSFTALYHYHEWQTENRPASQTTLENGQDYDTEMENTTFSEEAREEGEGRYSPYQFPHSTKVGTLLHHFLEQQDFQQPIQLEALKPLLESLDLDEAWLEPVQQWLETARTTRFSEDNIALSDISPQKRLNEWAFYLRLNQPNALPTLNQLLKAHHPLAKNLPELQLPQLEGYVRGFVDCIAQIGERFYLIDYKSNFLGYWAEDYTPDQIEKTMGKYRYDLQYLLYTLALHRYLKTRLGEGYNYERDFGGVAYLFLRGMNGTANAGVYFDKPSLELIEGLDRLFG